LELGGSRIRIQVVSRTNHPGVNNLLGAEGTGARLTNDLEFWKGLIEISRSDGSEFQVLGNNQLGIAEASGTRA
jgi:hypothetical protein